MTELADQGKVTLDLVMRSLRDGYDLFYLICHGALVEGQPHLWLEKEDGTAHVVEGETLVDRRRRRPWRHRRRQ